MPGFSRLPPSRSSQSKAASARTRSLLPGGPASSTTRARSLTTRAVTAAFLAPDQRVRHLAEHAPGRPRRRRPCRLHPLARASAKRGHRQPEGDARSRSRTRGRWCHGPRPGHGLAQGPRRARRARHDRGRVRAPRGSRAGSPRRRHAHRPATDRRAPATTHRAGARAHAPRRTRGVRAAARCPDWCSRATRRRVASTAASTVSPTPPRRPRRNAGPMATALSRKSSKVVSAKSWSGDHVARLRALTSIKQAAWARAPTSSARSAGLICAPPRAASTCRTMASAMST